MIVSSRQIISSSITSIKTTMASPFSLMQDDQDFIEQSKKDDRSEYVLNKVVGSRKASTTKSLECKIEHTDSTDILKQKKHHINNIGLLHITKGPKNQKTIDKINGLANVRFFQNGNIYYPGD